MNHTFLHYEQAVILQLLVKRPAGGLSLIIGSAKLSGAYAAEAVGFLDKDHRMALAESLKFLKRGFPQVQEITVDKFTEFFVELKLVLE